MESKAFHICPFCQSPSPVSVSRCVRCDRSLAGLPLPVYGSDVDATPMRTAPGDLVDLPLRDGAEETPRREAVPTRVEPPVAKLTATRRVPERRRGSRLGMMAVGAAIVGAAVVGGWLVRAQDHGERETPAVTVPAAVPPATIASTPAPVVLASAPASAPAPASSARVRPVPRPASVAPAVAPASPAAPAPWPVRRTASRDAAPARAATPVPVPDSEPRVTTVHPDVAAAPVDVERARDDEESEEPPPPPDVRVRPGLRARLDRALEHRDAVAERVRDLRARTNVPVIRDVDEYQRLQQELAAAMDELDQADAQVRRLQRALRRE